MPIHLKQNFWVDYANAARYGQKELVADLLSDQVAKAIVFDAGNVKKALVSSGVPAPKTKRGLLRAVMKNIDNNKPLKEGIVEIIKKNNPDGGAYRDAAGKQVKGPMIGLPGYRASLKRDLNTFRNLSGKTANEMVLQHQENAWASDPNTLRKVVLKTALLVSIAWVLIFVGGLMYFRYAAKKGAVQPGVLPGAPGQQQPQLPPPNEVPGLPRGGNKPAYA
jgi:hypothetical protein